MQPGFGRAASQSQDVPVADLERLLAGHSARAGDCAHSREAEGEKRVCRRLPFADENGRIVPGLSVLEAFARSPRFGFAQQAGHAGAGCLMGAALGSGLAAGAPAA